MGVFTALFLITFVVGLAVLIGTGLLNGLGSGDNGSSAQVSTAGS